MNNTDKLKALFNLDHNIKLYIPSTTDTSKSGTDASAIQLSFVTEALTLFSNSFGGSTAYEAVGAWTSPAAGLVTEKVRIVESYATAEAIEAHILEVLKLGEEIKSTMTQEAIALEYDNRIYFI